MAMESNTAPARNSTRTELFARNVESALHRKALDLLKRFGFEVTVRDTSTDAQALADLCWLDCPRHELPLIIIRQDELMLARIGRREILSGLSVKLRQVAAIRDAFG